MATVKLRNDQWKKMTFLRENPKVYVGQERQCRTTDTSSGHRFVEGVLWMLRGGTQWRLPPKKYGI